MTLEEIVNSLRSAGQDYGQLFNNNPKYTAVASNVTKGLENLVPPQFTNTQDAKSQEYSKKLAEWALGNGMGMSGMALTFIGKNAANWNPVKAAEAEKMLNAGVDPAQVWKEHLIGRMPDNSLFSEIDDSGARLLPDRVKENKGIPSYLLDSLHHPNFNKNYDINEPAFININDYFKSPSGSYANEGYGKGFVIDAPDYKTGASTALHELQHAIQDREGWARGGSPSGYQSTIGVIDDLKQQLPLLKKEKNQLLDNFMNTYDESLQPKMQDLDRKILKYEDIIKNPDQNLSNMDELSRQYYKRLTGEAQARATQDRMNMNMQQRRNTYPLAGNKLSDITLDQLINRYR